jgi:NifU-like protein
MWDYTEKVMDHFKNPRNVGVIEDADAVGEVGSLACGDALKLYLKVGDGDRITDAKFRTFGCASAIASASALTELVRGKTVDEAAAITNKDIADFLGGLPEQKMHCSVMGREALEAAVENYRTGGTGKHELEGQVVCQCFGITETEIERVVRENDLHTVEDVTNYCKAGGGCGGCHGKIKQIIKRVQGETEEPVSVEEQRPSLTIVQKVRLIQETIDKEIRPMLREDGGDIELVDIQGNKVIVGLRGRCAQCQAAGFTLDGLVGQKLREFVSPDIIVEEADE